MERTPGEGGTRQRGSSESGDERRDVLTFRKPATRRKRSGGRGRDRFQRAGFLAYATPGRSSAKLLPGHGIMLLLHDERTGRGSRTRSTRGAAEGARGKTAQRAGTEQGARSGEGGRCCGQASPERAPSARRRIDAGCMDGQQHTHSHQGEPRPSQHAQTAQAAGLSAGDLFDPGRSGHLAQLPNSASGWERRSEADP